MGIIQAFYGTSSLQLQREYIARFMSKADIKLRTVEAHLSRRSTTLHYHLPKDGQSVRVCQSMFLNTLNISEKTLRTTIARVTDKGTIEKEKRGGRPEILQEEDKKKEMQFLLISIDSQEWSHTTLGEIPSEIIKFYTLISIKR